MQLLANRYQIERQLGKKAGRQTFLAKDIQTHDRVVIKRLTFNHEFEWDDLKLFEREAATLKALSHPAIPQYLDYFEFDEVNGKGFALVQTYIDALSLEQHLKAGRTFTEAEVKQLAENVLDILEYLHTQHPPVIHRDIKPSNILLTDRSGNSPGQLYLVDFGSVQTLTARDGGTMTVVGTYGYMPPEQFGGRATPASDLYSLGATLIYLLTGQYPADLPQKDLRIEFQPITRLSPAFSRWLRSMTEPSLNRRFASAAQARQALNPSEVNSIAVHHAKPAGSEIVLTQNSEALEILLPGKASGRKSGSIVSVIGLGAFLTFWTWGALHGSIFFALFSIMFWWHWLQLVYAILFYYFGRIRLQLESNEISLTRELFGLETHRLRSAALSDIHQLELLINQSGQPVGLVISAGIYQYPLMHLNPLELEWLAQELSEWLDRPIERRVVNGWVGR